MILTCGEALIDMLPRVSTEGEQAFAPHAGGAVYNTAIALGRLGSKVGFFSGLSSDLFGDVLRKGLDASGVDHSCAHVTARPTTLAFVRLIDGQATYAFYDENTAGRMLGVQDLPQVTARAVFFGGISLVGEPCGSAYEALMAREAPAGVTMIDPNIRPGFITDEAAYRARIDRMMRLADIVKLSDEDLHWLMGDGEVADLARRIVAACGRDLRAVMADPGKLRSLDPKDFTDARFGLPTVRDILAELEKPGRDPRPSFKTASFAEGVEEIRDLKPGMLLEGTVTNVAAFGAFVDVGVHQDGLVHVSQLADKFVRDPHEVVKAGDVVKVRVVEVDVARKRIALTMKSDSAEARERAREQPKAPPPKSARPGSASAGPAGGGNAFSDALKGVFKRD